MNIVRKSLNFKPYMQSVHGAEVVFAGCEEVSLGYRQELVGDVLENVEVKGLGAALHSFEWPDDWGAPPTEQDLDNWSPPVIEEVKVLSTGEKAAKVRELVNARLFALYGELADESSVDEAVELIVLSIAKSLKKSK